MVRAEDDTGGPEALREKLANDFQRGVEDEDAAAIQYGEEELAARRIIGQGVGAAVELDARDRGRVRGVSGGGSGGR